MKRTILSILLLTACVCGAKAQSDTVYVYRNDGVISVFPKSGVDSIVCSQIDIDSLVHRDYVAMEVWTPEFIDRIPLEAVDSISFVYDKKNDSWSQVQNGKKTEIFRFNEDGTIQANLQDGRTIKVKPDAAGVFETRMAVNGANFYAINRN